MQSTPHIRLLAAARWQMLVNSMRTKKKWLDVISKIVVGLLGAILAFGGALSLGLLVYTGYPRRPSVYGTALGVVFWAWQFLPVITAAAWSMDFREIARYPISFRRFCLLEISTGLLDAVSATCLLWFAACWTGLLLVRPALAPRAAVMTFAMVAATLLINRVIFDYLEKLMSTRKGRARFFGGLMALSLGYQFLVFSGNRSGENVVRLFDKLSKAAGYLPAGLAASGVTGDMLPGLAGLAAYAILAGGPLLRLYRRKYQGEISSEGRGSAVKKSKTPGWNFPGLSESASAMLEKEVRYLLSQPLGFMAFLFGPFTALVGSLGFARRDPGSRELLFPFLAAWVILAIGSRAYNYFGFDAHGFDRYLLAPVTAREVIVSKNLLLGLLMIGNFLGAWLMLSFRAPVPAGQFLPVALGFLMAALASLASGNFFSVHFSFGVDPDRMRTQNTSGAATLGIMVLQFAICGVLAGTFYWKLPQLPVFGLLSLAAALLYWISIDSAARWSESHSEEIARSLVKD